MRFGGSKLLGLGALFAVAGAYNLVSNFQHSLTGVNAVATVLERSAKCSVEYKLADTRTTQDLGCDEARALQDRIGENKVKLKQINLSRLKLVGPAGATQEVTVVNALVVMGKGVGAEFPVVYDPANPDDVRAPMTLSSAAGVFGFMGVGLAMVFLALGLNRPRLLKRSAGAPAAPAARPNGEAGATGPAAARGFGRRNAA
jgi:hypothetical protein